MPTVSIADAGCLVAGAVVPALVAAYRRPTNGRWVPAIVGGLVGFVVNVVVL